MLLSRARWGPVAARSQDYLATRIQEDVCQYTTISPNPYRYAF